MAHFVGLDVSVKETAVCVVDQAGKVVIEQTYHSQSALRRMEQGLPRSRHDPRGG